MAFESERLSILFVVYDCGSLSSQNVLRPRHLTLPTGVTPSLWLTLTLEQVTFHTHWESVSRFWCVTHSLAASLPQLCGHTQSPLESTLNKGTTD